MTYAEMLSSIIQESRMSLRQIASKCEDLGQSITPSYISQLKNSKLPPPNPEVSIALAKACGSRLHAALVFLGYMEKAPEIIRDYMNNSTRLYKLVLENLSDGQGKVPLTREARDFISRLDVITAYELASTYLEQGNFTPSSQLAEELVLISGGAVKAGNDVINVFINDSSMAPTIPAHSMLTIMPTKISLLKEKDIIALYPYGRKMVTLRRIFFLKNQVLLIPEDTAHEIISVESLDQIDYVGKVMSYRVDL